MAKAPEVAPAVTVPPAQVTAMRRHGRWRAAALGVAAVLPAALWGADTAVANRHWYAGLIKPSFAPGPWLALVLLLTTALATSQGLQHLLLSPDYHPDRRRAIRAVLLALAFSAGWAWAFFVGRHPDLSLALAALFALAAWRASLAAAAVTRAAALLLIPLSLAATLVVLLDLSLLLRNG